MPHLHFKAHQPQTTPSANLLHFYVDNFWHIPVYFAGCYFTFSPLDVSLQPQQMQPNWKLCQLFPPCSLASAFDKTFLLWNQAQPVSALYTHTYFFLSSHGLLFDGHSLPTRILGCSYRYTQDQACQHFRYRLGLKRKKKKKRLVYLTFQFE